MKFILFLAPIALASQWATYPQVPKSASVNGFADPIAAELPQCAKDCANVPTSITPCPYWDTGCLCVMPQWAGSVASCFVASCSGDELASATSLAYSLCSSVGANLWIIPASISTQLLLRVAEFAVSATAGGESVTASFTYDTDAVASSTSDDSTSSTASETSEASSSSASLSSSSAGANGSVKVGSGLIVGAVAAMYLI